MTNTKLLFSFEVYDVAEVSAWGETATLDRAREIMKDDLKLAKWGNKPINTIVVEFFCDDVGGYTRVWGVDSPVCETGRYLSHSGTRVVIDGVVVFSNVHRTKGEDESDHVDCHLCHGLLEDED
jgi:hypothetical protein